MKTFGSTVGKILQEYFITMVEYFHDESWLSLCSLECVDIEIDNLFHLVSLTSWIMSMLNADIYCYFIVRNPDSGSNNSEYLASHYLHHLLGSPFASIDELPTSISPIEVAGALPGKDLKRKYIEHNRHVMVIYDITTV